MTTNPKSVYNVDLDVSDYMPLKTDSVKHTRLGWWIVLAGLGSFMLWAIMAPLDKGVPVTGSVTVAGNKKAVQHLTGGTVEAILVRDGDEVKAGQPLVRMNAVQAGANAAVIRVQYHTARSTEARLLAERDNKSSIAFPADVEAAKGDNRVADSASSNARSVSITSGLVNSLLFGASALASDRDDLFKIAALLKALRRAAV